MSALFNALRTAGVGCAAAVGIYFSAEIGNLDGKYRPVMIDHVIEKEVPALDANKVELTVRFTKVRACKIIDQDFYIKDAQGVWNPVFWENPASPIGLTTRPLGTFRVRWIMSYPPALIGVELRRVLRHQCWGPGLWHTVTDIIIPPRTDKRDLS